MCGLPRAAEGSSASVRNPHERCMGLAYPTTAPGQSRRSASISRPGVHVGDDKRARALARRCNEFAVQIVHSRPDRFGSFAVLPLPDVDGALEELSSALDVLEFDGVLLFSNVEGIYLEDPRLEPVFTQLDRRAATVFVHPNPSPDPVAYRLGLRRLGVPIWHITPPVTCAPGNGRLLGRF